MAAFLIFTLFLNEYEKHLHSDKQLVKTRQEIGYGKNQIVHDINNQHDCHKFICEVFQTILSFSL